MGLTIQVAGVERLLSASFSSKDRVKEVLNKRQVPVDEWGALAGD